MHRIVGFLALALVLYSGVMMGLVAGFPNQGARHEIGGPPVLTLELASNSEELNNLLEIPGYNARCVLKRDTHFDNFYIPTYTAFLLGFVWMTGRKLTGSVQWLLWAGLLTAVLAAVFDGLENYNIFAALGTTLITDKTAAAIRHPSLVKWFFLFVNMFLIALLLHRGKEQPFGKTANVPLAILMTSAALLGFVGLGVRCLIPLANLLFSILPLACLLLLRKTQKES